MKIDNPPDCEEILLQYSESWQQSQPGDTGCLIYRLQFNHQNAVLKYGLKGNAKNEIDLNYETYIQLTKQGLKKLNPEIYEFNTSKEYAYIIMQDLGSDISQTARRYPDKYSSFLTNFVEKISKIYDSNRVEKRDVGIKWIERIVNQFETYLNKALEIGLVQNHLSFPKSQISILAPQVLTFANGDLTPDNTFLVEGDLKLIDHKGILSGPLYGSSVIDLAMWDILGRHAYEFQEVEKIHENILSPLIQRELDNSCSENPELLLAVGEARELSLATYFGYMKGRPNFQATGQLLDDKIEQIKELLK